MRSLLKFLALALLIVLAGLWIMTVAKSCNKTNVSKTATDVVDATTDKITEVADDAEDLFKGETEEEGLFTEDGDEVIVADEEDDAIDEEDMEDDDEEADLDEELDEEEDETTTSVNEKPAPPSLHSGAQYLVIAGAFLTEANAKKEVQRLKKKGYDDAEVVVFDFSQYHSVCVQRTNSLKEANAIKRKLVNDGNDEAYVHKKRSRKKKK
ncbi:MAG TPA: SPOR domain-containing protein [Phaeodactylibacter sp.]|nr:SPOR domain-containing protein [Phaeodactylibacter sp.]